MGAALVLAAAASTSAQAARDYISIVGSSTVYPYATVVAERFGRTTEFATPKVESTGSGGGINLFCGGVGVGYPDIANSSRRIKPSEVELCARNGVDEIVEVKIGYDGIVIANADEGPVYNFSLREVYLALAKHVPDPAGGERLVPNPYDTWSDIDAALPDVEIAVFGPPPTSGTRDAFVELAMEGGCTTFDWIAALEEDEFLVACHTMREDGAYIQAGENDNLIVQKLATNPDALGIFGYSFLEQNTDKVRGSRINGVAPTFDTIASGDYPISRSLFFYVKKAHVGVGGIPGIEGYLAEFMSEDALGAFGYLTYEGLIPLSEVDRKAVERRVEALAPLQLSDLADS